jgi:putative DNA primase/helicase
MDRVDINDTLRVDGPDAARGRHDRAWRNARRKRGNEANKGEQGVRVLSEPGQPMAVARTFVSECCVFDGALTLRHWRGSWWSWQTSHWREVEDRSIRSLLYAFTERAVYPKDREYAPWAPNRRKIGDLFEALVAVCILPASFDQPGWLDERETGVIVALNNGLLSVEEKRLFPHTPEFFNVTAVPFDYDASASEPTKWLGFLGELWPDEPDIIDVLGEWFGYVISGRLDLHKIMLMVGPTRGGKGVIARILGSLIGRRNVAGPTLHSLGGDFGLAPLIGKPLAVIADARFVGKNSGVVVERLLSISGEDFLTVNIKYKEQWTGKLPARLHVMSNELPRLSDASTAIVGRLILLQLTRSWLGKEDHTLERRLQEELPGILNWALAGLERLTVANGNRFTALASSDEAIITMRDLASPVAAFVRERCKVRADEQVLVDELYAAYKAWAADNEQPKATKHVFGRDLRAAVPGVKKSRPREAEGRSFVYSGIALNTQYIGNLP